MTTRTQKLAQELSNMAAQSLEAVRRRKPKKPKKKGPPSKMVVLLATRILKSVGNKPYDIIEEAAADDGKMDLSQVTLGWFVNERDLRPMARKIDEWVGKWVEDSTNKRSLNGVGWDRLDVTVDLDQGTILLEGVLDGATISDPDQDIEVPAQEDMDDREIEQALKALGATRHDARWKFGHSDWSDISQISYDVHATWEFDPVMLAQKVLDQSKARAAIAKGVTKYEKYMED